MRGGGSPKSSVSTRSSSAAAKQAGGSSNFVKLAVIMLFSAGFIFGFLFIRGHDQGHAVTTAHGIPAAPEIGNIERPVPRIEVGEHDERHPKNVKQMISEGSSHDEHKSSQMDALKEQRSDQSEMLEGAGGASTAAATTRSSSIKAASKEEAKGAGAAAGKKEGKKIEAVVFSSTGAVSSSPEKEEKETAKKGTEEEEDKVGGHLAAGKKDKEAAEAKEEHHEVSSGVSSSAASLKHAAEHLKEATEMLKTQTSKKEEKAAASEEKAATKVASSSEGNEAKDAASSASKKGEETKEEKGAGSGSSSSGDKDKEKAAAAAKLMASINATKMNKTKAPPRDLLAYSKAQGHPSDTIHVLFTSNGSPYQNIQARIMVGTWHLARKMPGGEKMVAMTRILHRTTPDEVMDEIPTFRADPLQPECDKWCWFPVADRANAVQQWIDAAHLDPSLVKAPWLLLLETDYVWVKPLRAMGSAYEPEVPGLAFKFDYMNPHHQIVGEILKLKCPDCHQETVPGSGPAPVLMRFSDLRAATPLWEELSLWIETHKHAKDALGWVREMYAWDIGVAANKLNILTQGHPETSLISQPPHDQHIFNATMYHYTWGVIVKDSEGKEWWKFDKRFYTAAEDALKLPKMVLPPPLIEGLRMQDGMPFNADLHETMTDMLSHMNAAIDTLPNLLEKKAGGAVAFSSTR